MINIIKINEPAPGMGTSRIRGPGICRVLFFSARLHGGRGKAGGVVSAGTAPGDLSQDVPVRSPVPGADGIDEHLVGVVVVILLRLCGVEK